MADGSTPNFSLVLPEANRRNWTDKANGNFRLIDALIATYVNVSNLQGAWENSRTYTVGQNVVDSSAGVIYTAQVEHVSAAAPTTFAQDRVNHPTYWESFALAARQRGAWTSGVAYALNDFVLAGGTKYAMCIVAHTSGANFATDLAAGKWEVMIDLTAAGSLVLPVLSGPADANKVVIIDAAGTSYTISTVAAMLALLGTTGSGNFVLAGSPALTGNPTAPTASAEDSDTSIATTEYADRVLRNMVVRTQTFDASGTYTPHAKMVFAKIEAWGSGGGGGGSAVAATAGQAGQGGGGGAGAYVYRWVTKSQVGVSKSVTISAGGLGGAAGSSNGQVGGASIVDTLVEAGGGSGGVGNSGVSLNYAAGGAGGTAAGTFDDSKSGESGQAGVCFTQITGGRGGNTMMGNGGAPAIVTGGFAAAGGNGLRGSGGGGGHSPNGTTNQAGGNGGDGYVRITEYCYG